MAVRKRKRKKTAKRKTKLKAASIRLDDVGRPQISLPRLAKLDDINVQCNPEGCTINNSCAERAR